MTMLFGLLIVTWPGAGLLSVIWMIGGYAIFFGLLMFVVASRLRFRQRPEPEECPLNRKAPVLYLQQEKILNRSSIGMAAHKYRLTAWAGAPTDSCATRPTVSSRFWKTRR